MMSCERAKLSEQTSVMIILSLQSIQPHGHRSIGPGIFNPTGSDELGMDTVWKKNFSNFNVDIFHKL